MNASWSRRLLLACFTILLSLALFTPALAAKPEFFTIPVDVTFERGACDGFTVINRVTGLLKFSNYFDQDGNITMGIVLFIGGRQTFTNSETGATLSSPDIGIDTTTISQDGSTIVASMAFATRVVVPGEGLVYAHIGKIVFNENTGEVLFEAGQHDDGANLLPALCSALD
jgi:hypothetical protein